MGCVYIFVIIVALPLHFSAYVVSHSETDRSTTSVILKEEQSAEISCMTKGTGDFFWRKGETLYNSTLVAFFTVGDVTDDSQPYSVTANGTLHIRSVTLKDEGNYFCRLSSTENECYGEVKILVQASLRNFDLAIDRCDGESSCLLYLYPSQLTSLTCTAINAPPLMTLKWFNGSKEITEGIEQNEILPPNGNSREITSTVAAVYGHPAFLTCQAVDPKRSNDDVRFAHAHVEMTVPVHEALAIWIIVAGTLAGCFIIFVIFSLIQARAKGKKYKKKYEIEKEENLGLLEVKMSMQEEQNEEISRMKEEQNGEISRLKKEQNGEISRLKDKLRKTVEELKKSKNDNIDLQTKTAKDEAKITYAEKVAKSKDQEMTTTGQELTKLKSKVPDQIQEISSLKGDVQSKAKAIAELETKLQQRDEEIKKEKNENLELQTKIANNEAKLTAAKESAKTKNQEIKNKNQEIADLISKVTDQIQEMSTLKGDVQSKAKSIADLEGNLTEKDDELVKIRKELDKLKETIASAKGETTVAEGNLTEKDDELVKIRKELKNLKTNLQRKEIDIKKQSDQILKLKGNLKEKEDALREIRINLDKLKAIVNGKKVELSKTSKELADLKVEYTRLEELYKNLKSAEKGSHK